ncbi:hypothetical protein HQ47_02690 [Porphyromonas macacae]|uniref:Glutamyl-tRNA reductase n=1 Tax=Porphyromonas macacae TaxID=28115 RepID=A0A0A2E7G1_9PORP|nr:glutamyl-tRNA reductase [Porphyromonas macacae]KGN74843.1 hypothetical protein HQ47_02690 [Porphyromonas macacae]
MIGLIGINHNTAPVEIRERFALTDADAVELINDWITNDFVIGGIVLSTCNRIEIYFQTKEEDMQPDFNKLIRSLAAFKHIYTVDQSIFICKSNREAILHMFRLASGLESMVIGETQILGQLKDAFRKAIDNSQSTSILSRMFHKGFETAKKIRNNFLIAATPVSSGAAAVTFMDRCIGNRKISTLILGAGQMAETIYDRLSELEFENVKIYNRTKERAEKFAQTHGNIPCFSENQLCEALDQADLIFVATSSLMPIVTKEEIALRTNTEAVYLFDMAVPRNIAEDVRTLEFAHVYTIDDLRKTPEGEMIGDLDYKGIDNCIEEMVGQFTEWLDASQIRQVINVIQQASDKLLEKELSKLPSQLDAGEREIIEQSDQHLRITFSTAIIAALRDVTKDGKNLQYTEAINKLFSKILESE